MDFCKPSAYKSINSNTIQVSNVSDESYDTFQHLIDETTNVFNDVLQGVKSLFISE
jgi:hypothetical protein